MRRVTRWSWPVAAFLWLPSCALLSLSATPPPNTVPCVPLGVVFVVDGAGGFEASSRTLRQTIAEEKLPLEVRAFHWTHGYCRVLADQMHTTHLRREGQRLAEFVLRCRHEAPGRPVYLVGHSAGCGVILIATEYLPPNTVERIVLLAPAVSPQHDLRPALRSACRGLDVFISSHDWACLGLGTLIAGTTDRCRTSAPAGKNGFQPIVTCAEDEALYVKLRQYPWDPSQIWTGHKGGHYGSYQPGFLRAFVLPLFTPWVDETATLRSASTPERRR
jgi:pimeloyl-ACP methyl ester carboxylesterase